MVQNPEIQAKAQAQLDAVVGPDKLPEFTERESLPYIEALVLECFRWHPVTPLGMPHHLHNILDELYNNHLCFIGVPHLSTADDEYNGYFIPKGSIVTGNSW